jgi:hypothetical protein
MEKLVGRAIATISNLGNEAGPASKKRGFMLLPARRIFKSGQGKF